MCGCMLSGLSPINEDILVFLKIETLFIQKSFFFLGRYLNQGTSKHVILPKLGNENNTVSTRESLPILISL